MSAVNSSERLTERQLEERVFELAVKGHGIKGIAALLRLSVDAMVVDGRFGDAFKGGAALFNAEMEAKQRLPTTAERPTQTAAARHSPEPKPVSARGRKHSAESRSAELCQSLTTWKQMPARLRPSLRAFAREHGTSHQLLGYYLSTLEEH